MEDIDTDSCEGYRSGSLRQKGAFRPPHSDISKKLGSIDEQVDSGLGSLEFFSSELSNLSVSEEIREEDEEQEKDCAPVSSNLGSLDLANSISKLSLHKNSDRCDSGLDDEKQFDSTESTSRNEQCQWSLPPHFTPLQVMEIFLGDEDGDTHLHLSIIHGLPAVTMQIIGLAPDSEWLNQTNDLLQTPLHIAVITRQVLVVRRLMCAGASVDVRDKMGNTPLHIACRLGFEDVVRTLIKPVSYDEIYQNKYDIPFQRLPQDLEARNYEGLTCLHLAAIGGHVNVMRLLIGSGANVNTAEGKSGRTVLHLAAEWGNMGMLKSLLSLKDIEIDARTYAGLTPMLLAYGRRHLDIVAELYSRGAVDEKWTLSEDSDADISDEEMTEEAAPNRPFGALNQRGYQHTYR